MRTSIAVFAFLGALAACSDAPRSVPKSEQSQSQPAELPPGHPPLSNELPKDHPPIDKPVSDPSVVFSGRVKLVGALADAKTGFVFFSVRPKGQRAPMLSYRVDLADPELKEPIIVAESDGTRALHFLLNQRTSMMPGEVPRGVEIEFQTMYDPDGDIDTKDGRYEAVVPTKIGDEQLSVDLGGAQAGK